jgi:CDP-paratose 2-epimerase
LPADHHYFNGIAEDMSIDHSLHSVFGASKVAADIMVQEYGRYFGIPTVCFRGGTLTGPQHSASELHGFIAYLVRACLGERQYNIFGYQGKQVRDAIHSSDFVSAVLAVIDAPRVAEVYNIGGGRFSHASMIEAIALVEERCEKTLNTTYVDANRVGDHIWWVGDNSKFESHYPNWKLTYDLPAIIDETVSANRTRWSQ